MTCHKRAISVLDMSDDWGLRHPNCDAVHALSEWVWCLEMGPKRCPPYLRFPRGKQTASCRWELESAFAKLPPFFFFLFLLVDSRAVITAMLEVSSKLYHPYTRLITRVQRWHNKTWLNQKQAGLQKIGSPQLSVWNNRAGATVLLNLIKVLI